MLRAVLFDLDDTLLGNPMERFLPVYFDALGQHLADLVPPERLIRELMRATEAMNANLDPASTNEKVFASVFYPAVPCDRETLKAAFEAFYVEEFPKLRGVTERRDAARSLVSSALERGLKVVVATNPLFPRIAVEERLAWAGVPVAEFDYALVTTYETMHTTKSSLLYYREILQRLEVLPREALMVGDDWDLDVIPASSIGLHVYWTSQHKGFLASVPELVGSGTLSELWALVEARSWALLVD